MFDFFKLATNFQFLTEFSTAKILNFVSDSKPTKQYFQRLKKLSSTSKLDSKLSFLQVFTYVNLYIYIWCEYGVENSKNLINPSKNNAKIDLEQTPHDKPSVLNEQKVARTILMNGSVPWIETNWPYINQLASSSH